MEILKRSATVKDVFISEGVFDLRLGIGELQDLEESLKIGIPGIFKKFAEGEWTSRQLREVIRYSLIGGGLKPDEAYRITSSNVVTGYLLAYADPAMQVLKAALLGAPEDKASGEPEAAPEAPNETPTS